MAKTRTELFAAIRPYAPDLRFTPEAVVAIDALADMFGIPRAEGGDRGLSRAIANIKLFEGCELKAYPDPGTGGEPITIGWGATGGIRLGTTWTQVQADERLASDVAKFAGGVDVLLGNAPTTDGQRAALISFSYNVGLQALKESTLLRLHKEGDTVGAAGQFSRWVKAGGKTLNGLVRRREAEMKLYQS